MPTIPGRLLRTRAAAEYSGIAKSTLEKLRLRGEGPRFVKRGHAVYYDAHDLNAWIAALPRFGSTAEAKTTPAAQR